MSDHQTPAQGVKRPEGIRVTESHTVGIERQREEHRVACCLRSLDEGNDELSRSQPEYANQLVAMGTMGYKHEAMAGHGEATLATLSKTQINLKLIPGVDGRAEVCQLVAINLTDIVVKGSWSGPGRLHLVPHVNAPVADFPVRRVIGAHHFLADLTLPYGRVVYDYNKQAEDLAEAAE